LRHGSKSAPPDPSLRFIDDISCYIQPPPGCSGLSRARAKNTDIETQPSDGLQRIFYGCRALIKDLQQLRIIAFIDSVNIGKPDAKH
jgi:hypothetical protein